MLNLRIPISLTGLTMAAVAIDMYHVFIDALFPATAEALFWMCYVALGCNLYGYFFQFNSLVRPSVYRQRYRDLKELMSWTWTKLQQNRHLPAKYGRKAVREEPFTVGLLAAWGVGFAVQEVFGTLVGYIPYGLVILAFLVNEYRSTNDSKNTTGENHG